MSTLTFAYVLDPAEADVDDQLALLRGFCEQRGLVLTQEAFSDADDAVGTPWLERPGGMRLAAMLAPGVRVIVARASAVYTGLGDFQTIVQHFRAYGAALHIVTGAGQEFSTGGELWEHLLEVLPLVAAIKQSLHGATVSEAMQELKAKGVRHCRYAGYGWRWTRKGKRVPNAHEQAVIAKIVEWKEQGFSWNQIARTCCCSTFTRRAAENGRHREFAAPSLPEWSKSRPPRRASQRPNETMFDAPICQLITKGRNEMTDDQSAASRPWALNAALLEAIEQTKQRTCLVLVLRWLPQLDRLAAALGPIRDLASNTFWRGFIAPARDVARALPHLAEILAQPLEAGEVFRVLLEGEIRIDLCRVDADWPLAPGRDLHWYGLPLDPPGTTTVNN